MKENKQKICDLVIHTHSEYVAAGLDEQKKKRIKIMLEKWKMNRRRKAELKRTIARLGSLQMRLSRKTMRMEPVKR